MKLSLTSLPLVSLLALLASASPAANPEAAALLQARDVCGAGHEAYTRRIGSPCAASNGVHEFCSCDRTNIAKCKGGKWVDGKDCEKGGQECFARTDGAKAQCIRVVVRNRRGR